LCGFSTVTPISAGIPRAGCGKSIGIVRAAKKYIIQVNIKSILLLPGLIKKRRRVVRNVFFICVIMLAFVCGLSAQEDVDSNYVIREDDTLTITVRGFDEYTVKGRPVRMDGRIPFPGLGEIHVSGKTTTQLEEELTKRLEFLVLEPIVQVFVDNVASYWVLLAGNVSRTGKFAIGSPTSGSPTRVLDVLASAGGPTEKAKIKDIKIVRYVNGREVIFRFNYKDVLQGKNLNQNILLENRDTIMVP
jgi:polysaccharide export outer membrane protein